MSARLRRLYSDYERIQNEFARHRYIKIVDVNGNPPERYRILYNVKSLCWDEHANRPFENSRHEVEIYLPQDYPREKPQCTIHTPIFHPNFSSNHSPNIICIGDYWAASNSLTDVIVQIGEMLQFQTYNIKSPLNAMAARWALENGEYLPVGNVDLYQPEPDVQIGVSDSKGAEDEINITIGAQKQDSSNDFDIILHK